jgi:hypothetical protein
MCGGKGPSSSNVCIALPSREGPSSLAARLREWPAVHQILYSYKLYKIWGRHGGDYEECRLLGYKIPVRTWQETHYVSGTEPNQLNTKDLSLSWRWLWWIPSFGMLRCVAFVRSDLSEECFASIIRVERISEQMCLARWFLSPWWWGKYVPPEHRFLKEPHGVTSHRMAFFCYETILFLFSVHNC